MKTRIKKNYNVWYSWRAPASANCVILKSNTLDSATSAQQLRKNWKRIHPHVVITRITLAR